jgi:hypothetical protein
LFKNLKIDIGNMTKAEQSRKFVEYKKLLMSKHENEKLLVLESLGRANLNMQDYEKSRNN